MACHLQTPTVRIHQFQDPMWLTLSRASLTYWHAMPRLAPRILVPCMFPMKLKGLRSHFSCSLFHPHDAVSNRVRPDGFLRPLTPPFGPFEQQAFSDTPSNIRANTVQLSGMRISSPSPAHDTSRPTATFVPPTPREVHSPSPLMIEPSTPRAVSGPSALSVLIAESRAGSREASRSPTRGITNASPGRISTISNVLEQNYEQQQIEDDSIRHRPQIQKRTSVASQPSVSDTTPLLVSRTGQTGPVFPQTSPLVSPHCLTLPKSRWARMPTLKQPMFLASPGDVFRAMPAVVLGLLLNILDGVSYGMIVFPASGVFSGFGGTGVSMFFVT
jgi:sulfate permease, SulP family